MFHWDGVNVCKDGPKDVSLAVGEGRLDGLDQVRHIVFEGGEKVLVESEASVKCRYLGLKNSNLFLGTMLKFLPHCRSAVCW